MTQDAFQKTIPLSQIFLDIENPRFIDLQENEYDAIRSMAKLQGDKIINLAKHLVNNGPNPSELPIVIPFSKENETFIVVDGNRRIAALKLLETTTICNGIFTTGKFNKLKKIAVKYENNPIEYLRCVVFPDRETADIWIQLRHRGQQEGVGLVPWDGQASLRYDARKRGKRKITIELLDFVNKSSELSKEAQENIETGKFVVTNLERLINTPYVRDKVGIDTKGGKLSILYPKNEVIKGLKKIVEDVATNPDYS